MLHVTRGDLRLHDGGDAPVVVLPVETSPIGLRLLKLLKSCQDVEGAEPLSLQEFDPPDALQGVEMFRVRFSGESAVLFCLSGHAWRDPAAVAHVTEIKSSLRERGSSVWLLPAFAVRREMDVSAGIRTPPACCSASDRLRVLLHLFKHGPSSIATLSNLMSSSIPIMALLSMAGDGLVEIDLDSRLELDTLIEPALPWQEDMSWRCRGEAAASHELDRCDTWAEQNRPTLGAATAL